MNTEQSRSGWLTEIAVDSGKAMQVVCFGL